MKTIARIALCALVHLAAGGGAFAQPYPSTAIHMLVAFPPGGSNDVLARLVSKKLSEALGQPVLVENKPGANGILGTELAKNSRPNGYTLLMGSTGTHTINPALYNKLPYDPIKDFKPVTLVASTPMAFLVHPSVPALSLQELIMLAKKQPGKLAYGAGSSIFNLTMELLKSRTGMDLIYVPYRGSVPALTELLSGNVQVVVDVIQGSQPHIKKGTMRILAVSSRTRSAVAPDVPTVIESGVPDFEVIGWTGLYAPAGTEHAIITKLDAEIRRMLKEPDVREIILGVGYEPRGLGPDDFTPLMEREIKQFKKVVSDAHIPKMD